MRMPTFRRQKPHSGTNWQEIGNTPARLLEVLTELYWDGVNRDVLDIIETLSEWRHEDYTGLWPMPPVPDLPGMQTFLQRATGKNGAAMASVVQSSIAHEDDQADYDGIEIMARILLQGAAFLDIDKLAEYRPPLHELGIWLRPRAPQLTRLPHDRSRNLQDLQPLLCGLCSQAIRGARFSCSEGCLTEPEESPVALGSHSPTTNRQPYNLCESCVRKNHGHAQGHLQKMYKNCALTRTVSATESRQICRCPNLPPGLHRGRRYPFKLDDLEHHEPTCMLRSLKRRHCQVKYEDVRRHQELQETAQQAENDTILSFSSNKNSSKPSKVLLRRSLTVGATSSLKNSGIHSSPALVSRNSAHSDTASAKSSSTFSFRELSLAKFSRVPSFSARPTQKDSQESQRVIRTVRRPFIKPVAKSIAQGIPYGNVHMALMLGPLIIENGAEDSKRGALITIRSPLRLLRMEETSQHLPKAICLSQERKIYSAERPYHARRVRCYMKQVVGGLFSGLSDEADEFAIITDLVQGSKECMYDSEKTTSYREQKLAIWTRNIISKLRNLISKRLREYLRSIINRLFHRDVQLRWDIQNNHCQKFCEILLDRSVFSSFIATKPHCQDCLPNQPLYLVSFVCRYGSYDGFPHLVRPRTKRAAPNGLIEEYLLRFRKYGHHNDSDILDTLMEYWSDWGAFGTPPFKCQSLFPWDCTEAYRMGSEDPLLHIKCGKCSLPKHVWAFPFDSWSIIQFHLFRDSSFYLPPKKGEQQLSEDDWIQNRIEVLAALQSLNIAAVAMVKSKAFRKHCLWASYSNPGEFIPQKARLRRRSTEQQGPKSHNGQVNNRLPKTSDRIRLSGIHRAQPQSHLFEQAKYHDCTLAKWADLVRKDQIKEYINLRDFRAVKLLDIPIQRTRSNLPRDHSGWPRWEPRFDNQRNYGTGADSSNLLDIGRDDNADSQTADQNGVYNQNDMNDQDDSYLDDYDIHDDGFANYDGYDENTDAYGYDDQPAFFDSLIPDNENDAYSQYSGTEDIPQIDSSTPGYDPTYDMEVTNDQDHYCPDPSWENNYEPQNEGQNSYTNDRQNSYANDSSTNSYGAAMFGFGEGAALGYIAEDADDLAGDDGYGGDGRGGDDGGGDEGVDEGGDYGDGDYGSGGDGGLFGGYFGGGDFGGGDFGGGDFGGGDFGGGDFGGGDFGGGDFGGGDFGGGDSGGGY